MSRVLLLALISVAASVAAGCQSSACSSWQQFGQSSSHNGEVCVSGQMPARILAKVTVDQFASDEVGADGDLRVHYQVPLVVGDDVYVLQKGGSFTPPCAAPDAGAEAACFSWDSQTWNEAHYAWENGSLVLKWTFAGDWKPVPSDVATAEQVFQPAIVGDRIFLPGASGGVHVLDRNSGQQLQYQLPVGDDPDTYVAGPMVADVQGNVYYNAIHLDHVQPLFNDATGWIIKLGPDGTAVTKDYNTIVPNAPTNFECHGSYYDANPIPNLPWPPLDANGNVVPAPSAYCGSQRPGINVGVAIGKDGSVYTVSRAAFDSEDSFLVALDSNLNTRWATSLRGIFDDGCGVDIPDNGDPMNNPYACAPGSPNGIDPATGVQPAGRVIDESSSSPVALPDGAVLYGSFSGYNDDRGHLIKFDPNGKVLGTFDFGWDYTPAVWQHDGTYSLIVKDNHYIFDENGVPLGPYYVTQLSADLKIEWQFQSTNTQSCPYASSGKLQCVADHPHGFEWCINAPAVDDKGTIFAGGEDGVVYAIGQGGKQLGKLFLGMAIGASYTPLAIDHAGRLYAQDDGQMKVLGN